MSEQLYLEIGGEFNTKYETELSQMFGKKCIKIKKKAFAAFFQDAMVFKLGKEEIALVRDKYIGAVNWDPSGKDMPMKDWLQIPFEYYADWKNLALQSMKYVLENEVK